MDTGTPLDAVDEQDVSEHADSVREVDPILLDTANGTTEASRVLDMYLGPLGEQISPYVLTSTPNILSLGRRVVDGGYTFVWPGYSMWPYFVHPTTGKHIYLRVEDYSPYLDECWKCGPVEATKVASVVCSVAVPRSSNPVMPATAVAQGTSSSS